MSSKAARVMRRLNLAMAGEVEAYERAFHAAFVRATHNRLVRQLWEWDDAAGRLRTRIPYDEQAIWVLPRDPGLVTGGIAVNVAMRQLQAAAFGFGLPDMEPLGNAARRYCEVLTLFLVRRESLRVQLGLWREVFGDLRGMGFTHALATTSPKVFALYRFAGARILGETWINGEQRIFMEFDLGRSRRVGREPESDLEVGIEPGASTGGGAANPPTMPSPGGPRLPGALR